MSNASTKVKTEPAQEQKSYLQQLLDEYSNDVKRLTKIDKKQFETGQVATMINALPERKWNAANAYINATTTKEMANKKVKSLRASKRLQASKKKDTLGLSSDEDRKAWVDQQEDVQNAEIELINAEAEMLAAKLGYECLDDLFTAGKKIMGWLVDEDKSQREYDKYVNEGRRNQ